MRTAREKKWDLAVPNHLLSAPPVLLKLFFRNTADLQAVRRELLPLAIANASKFTAVDAYADVVGAEQNRRGDEDAEQAWGEDDDARKRKEREPSECIVEIREHDIAYHLRVAIDLSESSSQTLLAQLTPQTFVSVSGTTCTATWARSSSSASRTVSRVPSPS